jgi:hypothetical protein
MTFVSADKHSCSYRVRLRRALTTSAAAACAVVGESPRLSSAPEEAGMTVKCFWAHDPASTDQVHRHRAFVFDSQHQTSDERHSLSTLASTMARLRVVLLLVSPRRRRNKPPWLADPVPLAACQRCSRVICFFAHTHGILSLCAVVTLAINSTCVGVCSLRCCSRGCASSFSVGVVCDMTTICTATTQRLNCLGLN